MSHSLSTGTLQIPATEATLRDVLTAVGGGTSVTLAVPQKGGDRLDTNRKTSTNIGNSSVLFTPTASRAYIGVQVMALASNQASLWFSSGPSSGALSTIASTGFPLLPGDSIFIPLDHGATGGANNSVVTIQPSRSGEGVAWAAVSMSG